MTTTARYSNHRIDRGPFRQLDHQGQPIEGTPGLIYADDAIRDGYQLVRAEDAKAIHIGDLIPVGTRYDIVSPDDERPGDERTDASGTQRKTVCSDWRPVVEIGSPYEMAIDLGHYDDSRSPRHDGFIGAGRQIVKVRRLYFAR